MCRKSKRIKYEFERTCKEWVMTSQGLPPASTNICDVTRSCPSDKHKVCRQICWSRGLIWASGQVTVTRKLHGAFPRCPAHCYGRHCSLGLIWASGQVTVTRKLRGAFPRCPAHCYGRHCSALWSQNQLAFGAGTILKL